MRRTNRAHLGRMLSKLANKDCCCQDSYFKTAFALNKLTLLLTSHFKRKLKARYRASQALHSSTCSRLKQAVPKVSPSRRVSTQKSTEQELLVCRALQTPRTTMGEHLRKSRSRLVQRSCSSRLRPAQTKWLVSLQRSRKPLRSSL
jgi:hypothetical protein